VAQCRNGFLPMKEGDAHTAAILPLNESGRKTAVGKHNGQARLRQLD
jgi:hypothetical protein